jgi:hypothetical protein
MKTIHSIFVLCILSVAFAQETRFFIVGYGPKDDSLNSDQSFVVPMSNPSDIAVSRSMRELGITGLARVGLSSSHYNRNYMINGAPFHPWEINNFLGYAEVYVGIYFPWEILYEELCNGTAKGDFWMSFSSSQIMGELPFGDTGAGAESEKNSELIGVYSDLFWPYINSDELGGIYVYGMDPFNIWIYSATDETWYWLSHNYGNYQWRYNRKTGGGDWVYYARDYTSGETRWYYNCTADAWECVKKPLRLY